MLSQSGTGQQCSVGNTKFPQTVECFSSLSHNRGPKKISNGKFISLMPVCFGSEALEEKK